MSMNMMKKQSKIKSTDDFIRNMIKDRPPAGVSLKPSENIFNRGTQTGFNPQAVSLMANQIATPDVCDPRPMTVRIPADSDPRVVFWPSCTQLDQCGGCCGHDLLECAPTSTEPVTVQVMKQRLRDDDSYDFLGNVDVTLQRHLACDCRCKIKAEDCDSSTQYYDEASCACRCRNAEQSTSCLLPKRWDQERCRCVCSNLISCLDDEVYDFNTCSCLKKDDVASAAAAVPFQALDPCAGMRCRTGMQPVRRDSSCQCRPRRSPARNY